MIGSFFMSGGGKIEERLGKDVISSEYRSETAGLFLSKFTASKFS